MAGTIATLLVRLGVDFADFEKKIGQAERTFAKTGRKLESIGASLTKGLTLPLVAVGGVAVAAALKIDDAMDTIRTTTGKTGQDFEALGESFRSVLGTVPSSVEDVATAIGTLSVRTGATGERLEDLSRQMLNLARLTKSDVGPLIESTSKIFGDWRVSTEKQSEALDFLFKTSQQTGISVGTLSETLTQFGAPLRDLGFSLEEAATLLGKFEKEGVNTEAVLAGMRTGLGKLAKAGEEPAETFKRLIKTIGEMSSKSDAGKLAIEAFGIKAGPQLASAIQNGRFAIDDLLKSIKDSPETINKAAKATDGFAEQFLVLKNKVLLALEPVGVQLLSVLESVMPLILNAARFLGNMAEQFSKLPGPVKLVAGAFLGLVAAIGPVTFGLGQLLLSGSALLKFLPVLKTSWVGMTGALATAGPFIAVGALLAGLLFALNETWKGVVNLKNAWDEGRFLATVSAKKDNPIRSAASSFFEWSLGLNTTIKGVKDFKFGLSTIPSVASGVATAVRGAVTPVTDLGNGLDLTGEKARALAAKLEKAKRENEAFQKSVRDLSSNALTPYTQLMTAVGLKTDEVRNLIKGLTAEGFIPASSAIQTTNNGIFDFNQLLAQTPPVVSQLDQEIKKVAETTSKFGGLLDNLGPTILAAFTGGGNALKSIGALLGNNLGLSLVKNFGTSITKKLGDTFGGIVNSILPGIGGLVGPLFEKVGGFFANLFGGEGRKTNKLRDEFIAAAGGLDKLKDIAETAGFSLDKLLSTKKVKDFEREVGALNGKIKEHEQAIADAAKRWDGLQIAVGGVNARAQSFATMFDAAAEGGQAAFERLGRFVGATFAGMVKETGDAVGALNALAPALSVLSKGMTDFGLTGTATIDRLLVMFKVVNDEGIKPIFDGLAATGQILKGFDQAGMLTASLFQDIGADIGQTFRDLQAKGVDMSVALALSQPVLQRLWEAQEIYGEITDETTRKILKQAEDQGLVGAHMKDVNSQILDVLIAIADVFGADIPDAMRKLKPVVQQTAKDFEDTFGKMRIPPIDVPVIFKSRGASVSFEGGGSFNIPGFQHGGVVSSPMVARVGEVPEAIIPLSQLDDVLGRQQAGSQELNVYVAVDPQSQRIRVLKEDERRQIQNWMDAGKIQVPTRAVRARSR